MKISMGDRVSGTYDGKPFAGKVCLIEISTWPNLVRIHVETDNGLVMVPGSMVRHEPSPGDVRAAQWVESFRDDNFGFGNVDEDVFILAVEGATGEGESAPLPRDNCVFCLGAKGGVKGNENVVNDVVVCDYCSIPLILASNSLAKTLATFPKATRQERFRQDTPRMQIAALIQAAQGDVMGLVVPDSPLPPEVLLKLARGLTFMEQAQDILKQMPEGQWEEL